MPVPINILHDRQTITFGSDILSDFVKLQMSKEIFVREDQTHDVKSNDHPNHERFNQSKSQELSSNSPNFESSSAPTDNITSVYLVTVLVQLADNSIEKPLLAKS